LPYYIRTWFELRRTLFSWMQIEKWMWFIVLSLIIIVAAFNILSTLIMVSMEKRRDIGILKAMGSQRHAIARIFSYQGLLVGVVGAALGLFLGWLICFLQLHYKFVLFSRCLACENAIVGFPSGGFGGNFVVLPWRDLSCSSSGKAFAGGRNS
jgi:lipoprotein-releasing system permease protein